jgi:uncharacterized sodium:solute symporter family permease YidK
VLESQAVSILNKIFKLFYTLIFLPTCIYKQLNKFNTIFLEAATISTTEYFEVYRRVEYNITMGVSERFGLPSSDYKHHL